MLRTKFAIACLVLAGWSCGGGENPWVREGRAKFDAGELEAAERLIADSTGEAADGLRQEIAKAREARAQVEREVKRILADVTQSSVDQARVQLTGMRQNAKDPVSRERIGRALEDLTTLVVTRTASAKDREAAAAQERMAAEAAAETQRIAAVLNEIRRAMGKKEWISAFDLLDKAEQAQSAPAADLADLRVKVKNAAIDHISDLVRQAQNTEMSKGSKAAYDLIHGSIDRFPATLPELENLQGLEHDLARRAGIAK